MHRMKITVDGHEQLEAVIRKRSGSGVLAQRARCVLLWADGERRVDISAKLANDDRFVARWITAFEQQGLAGPVSLHLGPAPPRSVAKLVGLSGAGELMEFDRFPQVQRALAAFVERPAVQRGLAIPARD